MAAAEAVGTAPGWWAVYSQARPAVDQEDVVDRRVDEVPNAVFVLHNPARPRVLLLGSADV